MKEARKEGIERREFLKRAGLAAAGLGLAACAPAAVPTPVPTKTSAPPSPATAAPAAKAVAAPTAGDADALAKLYEAAKREGEVMVYMAGTQEEVQEIAAAFQKKYPGLKVNGFVGTSEAMKDKAFTEAKARKVVGEVVAREEFPSLYAYTQEGVLDAYLSPEARSYDTKNYDPKGLWYIHGWYPLVLEYNTKAISKEQAPKSYADLLKPEFKGKLGLEASAVSWFTQMLRIMGRDKGLEYMKALAGQKPRLISGHWTLQRLISSGEIPVAVYMYGRIVIQDKQAGAPVEWVDPVEVTPTTANLLLLLKDVPHPNAAKLMLDFWLSDEGARIMLKQGFIPTRKGIDLGQLADLAKVDSLIVNDPAIGKEKADNEQVFREIFGKA